MESTSLDTKAHEVAGSHTIGATTFSVGYGEIIDGNKYWTYGADKKIGENFSMYAGYEVTDKPTGTDTTNMAAGIKFKF